MKTRQLLRHDRLTDTKGQKETLQGASPDARRSSFPILTGLHTYGVGMARPSETIFLTVHFPSSRTSWGSVTGRGLAGLFFSVFSCGSTRSLSLRFSIRSSVCPTGFYTVRGEAVFFIRGIRPSQGEGIQGVLTVLSCVLAFGT